MAAVDDTEIVEELEAVSSTETLPDATEADPGEGLSQETKDNLDILVRLMLEDKEQVYQTESVEDSVENGNNQIDNIDSCLFVIICALGIICGIFVGYIFWERIRP